jgi:N-dimethylarginine dimethylaminohydrolase
VGAVQTLLVKHARDAFVDEVRIAREWRSLGYLEPPQLERAIDEYDRFLEVLGRFDLDVHHLPAGPGLGLGSIYVRDAAVVCDRGVILGHMGKQARAGEPDALLTTLRDLAVPVAGRITAPGQLEGGDFVWIDTRTAAVGRGYRTNDEGIRQLRAILDDAVDELIAVPLPHWRGPGDVFHLMSIISPVDRDLALVYSPLMPVPFREWLTGRGIELVEVPDEEFASLGANVLAVAPRTCVVAAGNPLTRRRLEQAGATVHEFEAREIGLKGGGGPTCLTRPLWRTAKPGR